MHLEAPGRLEAPRHLEFNRNILNNIFFDIFSGISIWHNIP